MPERQDGAILSPSRSTGSQAVTVLTEKEETWIDDGLTREWGRGKALYSWLGDAIHEAEVFVPSFGPWTNLAFQIVNESSVLAENADDLGFCSIDLVPIVTVVSSACTTPSEYRNRLPGNREHPMDVRSFECADPFIRSWVSLEACWYSLPHHLKPEQLTKLIASANWPPGNEVSPKSPTTPREFRPDWEMAKLINSGHLNLGLRS